MRQSFFVLLLATVCHSLTHFVDFRGVRHRLTASSQLSGYLSRFRCPAPGFYRHPTGCHRFYRCVREGAGYAAFEFRCPAGLVFDERFQVCNWPWNSPSCSGLGHVFSTPTEGNFRCPSVGFFRDAANCRHFHVCEYQSGRLVSFQFHCPHDLVFDEGQRMCTWRWNTSPCSAHDYPPPPTTLVRDANARSVSSTNWNRTLESHAQVKSPPIQLAIDKITATLDKTSSDRPVNGTNGGSAGRRMTKKPFTTTEEPLPSLSHGVFQTRPQYTVYPQVPSLHVITDVPSPAPPVYPPNYGIKSQYHYYRPLQKDRPQVLRVVAKTKPRIFGRRISSADDVPGVPRKVPFCARQGTFPHPTSCAEFFQCYWDRWLNRFTVHSLRCPPGLVFDPSAAGCDWPGKSRNCI